MAMLIYSVEFHRFLLFSIINSTILCRILWISICFLLRVWLVFVAFHMVDVGFTFTYCCKELGQCCSAQIASVFAVDN